MVITRGQVLTILLIHVPADTDLAAVCGHGVAALPVPGLEPGAAGLGAGGVPGPHGELAVDGAGEGVAGGGVAVSGAVRATVLDGVDDGLGAVLGARAAGLGAGAEGGPAGELAVDGAAVGVAVGLLPGVGAAEAVRSSARYALR